MKNYRIADINLAKSGRQKIDWVWQYMPVIRSLLQKYAADKPLRGLTVAACLHLEAKTASLLKTLHDLGAKVVAAGSNPLSTQDDVCAALVEYGVYVYSHHGMSTEDYFANLMAVLEHQPDIVVDDGADLIATLLEKRPDLVPKVKGGSEETTTGILRLKAMVEAGVLPFPMIAVNDANSKYLFDNRYGTGQSVWDGFIRTTNCSVAGKAVVVVGYGWCGKGVALRAKGLGARVIVVEVDYHKAYEAAMDGHTVMNMQDAAKVGEIFLTLTGNINVIRKEHFTVMQDGVILANAGHFDIEISKPDLAELAVEFKESRPNIGTYIFADGRRIHLLAEGRLVNLAAADGHPIEIMDLSFALQLESILYVNNNHQKLEPKLYDVPTDIDQAVMITKLNSVGITLDKLTEEQKKYLASWE